MNTVVTAANVVPLMPPDWQPQICEVARTNGKLVYFRGGAVSTSLEGEEFVTGYTVVTGPQIELDLPWLWQLYHGSFRKLVSLVTGQEVVVDPDKKFSANINMITLATQRHGYELHTDINPVTGLLPVSTMKKGDGGELLHMLPDGRMVVTRIKAGWFLIFDGRNHPHKVNPLNPQGGSDTRITVPMDYVFPGWDPKRPGDMDVIFGNGDGKAA